jgi:hypothetical protein
VRKDSMTPAEEPNAREASQAVFALSKLCLCAVADVAAQVPLPAVAPVSQPARCGKLCGPRVWKPATQQTRRSALRRLCRGRAAFQEFFCGSERGRRLNCPALDTVAEWVWKVVGGINPDDANPGFKNVIIKPEPGGGLTNAVASLNSIRGPIATSWTNNTATTNYTLNVTVPANATASVYIPSTNLLNITESGVPATTAPGVKSNYFINWPNWTNGATVFQVGAGTYQFTTTGVTF